MRRTMLTCGSSASDAKDRCTRTSYAPVETALYSIEESKQRRTQKKIEKYLNASQTGEINRV